MNSLNFASRNTKEIIRDPLTLIFSVGFPLVLLILLTVINNSIPEEAVEHMTLFKIENLAPGISVFGLSFMSLFSSILIAKDRTTGFMLRLFTSPLKSSDFIIGYTVPMIPMSIIQTIICYIAALFIGLDLNINILLAVVVNIPIAIVFIALGLLFGTILNEKAVGGVCGALLTNLSAWFSDIWFDISMIGGAFEGFCNCLPFVHAVKAARAAVAGNYGDILPELIWVIVYAVVLMTAAIIVFSIKTKKIK